MTANAGSSTWLAWSDNVAQSLADADHGTIRLSVELRSGRIAIAGVKQSCGRKCARLVDWLSFPPIPQIIGKGAPRIGQHATYLWESAPANLHRIARNHVPSVGTRASASLRGKRRT